MIPVSKYLHDQNQMQKQKARLDTTAADFLNETNHHNNLQNVWNSTKA